jgi:hypothetical protein
MFNHWELWDNLVEVYEAWEKSDTIRFADILIGYCWQIYKYVFLLYYVTMTIFTEL